MKEKLKAEFVKAFESYFTNLEMTDFDRRKLNGMLDNLYNGIVSHEEKTWASKHKKVKIVYRNIRQKKANGKIMGFNRISEEKIREITESVCRDFNITEEQLKGNRRFHSLARAEFTKRVLDYNPFVPYRLIGEKLGGRHHTTIIHYKQNYIDAA